MEVAQFLDEIRRNERFEDWQAQQAYDARQIGANPLPFT